MYWGEGGKERPPKALRPRCSEKHFGRQPLEIWAGRTKGAFAEMGLQGSRLGAPDFSAVDAHKVGEHHSRCLDLEDARRGGGG